MLRKQSTPQQAKLNKRKLLASLRARLLVLVLLSLIPALGLILYTASEQRRTATAEVRENALRLTRLAANNQKQISEGTRQLLITLSHVPTVRNAQSPECDRLLANLLKQYPAYANLNVLDAKGNSLCSPLAYKPSVSANDRKYFERALQTRKFAVGDYQIDRVTKKATVNFAYPVINKAGQLQVVIVAALDLAQLNQLAARVKLPENSVLSVVDPQGTLLVRYPEPEKWVGKRLPKDSYNWMRSAREGYYKVNSLDGIPRIFAFVPLGDDPQNPDAYVRIGIPLSVAFAKADWLLTRNLLGFGAVSILALVAAWVGGNVFLLEQVKSLVETTQQLKEGKLNARSRLVDEVGELGQLACAFNSMAESLEMRVNELQTLFDVLPIAIAIAEDPQCKYIRVNPAGAKLLKLAPDTNASITPSQGQLPPPYKIFRAGRELNPQEIPLQYAVHKGVKVQDVEIELVYQDGTAITLLCFATPLFDGENQPRGGICAFLDINERKQTEKEREQLLEREQRARAEAEAANRIKDEFLAVLSHELRTPLNPILGWSKLLRSREFDKTATDRALETIERNAKLQSQLIEDLLDVSRIIRGKLSLSSCPVDLFMTIQAAMETVRLSAQAKSIALKFSIDTSDGGVAESWDDNTENSLESEFQVTYTQYPISNSKYLLLGDSNRLQQVMWNLLSNAIKFTPNGGRVEIELSKEVNRELGIGNRETTDRILKYARVSVKDTGIGIDSVFLPYVFECFRQENSSTTRKFGGLGLGLAIVRHLVELHGGTVQAESQGIGLGATFTVRLPLTPDPLDVPQHEIQSNLGLNLQGIRILLVDDEPDARDFLTVSLEHYGAIVTAVPSAKEALAAIAQFQPDILLSDIGMPEVNGYMLMRQVRTLPPERGGQIPAIAITAYAGEFDRKQALQAGFQAHISKPIDLVNLVEEIASLALKPQLKMFNSP